MSARSFLECMFSPRLIKIYGNGPVEKFYQPNTFERWGDQVIHSLYVICKIGVYTSPFLVGILYQRGYFTPDGLLTLTKIVAGVGVILIFSFCSRGLSRSYNPTYQKFLNTLQKAQSELTPSVKRELNMYDFEFAAWPIEYSCKTAGSQSRKYIEVSSNTITGGTLDRLLKIPYHVIAYCAIKTFGIRLLYPGTLGLLQAMLEQSLLQGRSRLIELFKAERFKIETVDNNEIDTIFIDRRNSTPYGNTLVIACEGNAGFYEIGVAITPIEAGYSVLGWNHPGFGGSTGTPFPRQEQNAIDAVVQFAINKLGYKIENILFFGWSIGGYTSSWAAMNYPESKGIILDATFDDILPLAVHHMPSWWAPIVNIAIRQYANLNVYEQLIEYPGPISLIRRTQDEVICLKDGVIGTNRANDLLIKLLRHRYPCLFEDTQSKLLEDYLAVTGKNQDDILSKFGVDEHVCQSLLQSYISEYTKSYPMKIGQDFNEREKSQMALFLAKKYLKDFSATHCINLPTDMFQLPWDINVESDYVFT